MRWLALILGLVLASPARADMFPNAANADQPEALQNLTNQILTLSGGVLRTGTGTSFIWGTGDPQVWGIYKGTAAAPITAAGQQIKIVVHEEITKDKCFDNPSDGVCVSPLVVEAYGAPGTTMVTQAATFYAVGRAPIAGQGVDIQGLSAVADVKDGGAGAALGAYLQARKYNVAGHAIGAEISAGNYSGADNCLIRTVGVGYCVGVWVGARSDNVAAPLDSAVQIGTDAGVGGFGRWRQGITLNDNAFGTGYANTVSWGDYSGSETSLYIRGNHTYAMRTDPDGGGIVGLGTFTPTAKLEINGNYSAPYSTTGTILSIREFAVTDTTSSGVVLVANANRIGAPLLRATNPTTYTEAATLTIGGCPTADTNVTITKCYAIKTGGPIDVGIGAYWIAGAPGVSCTGAPTAGFRSVGGIVTVC